MGSNEVDAWFTGLDANVGDEWVDAHVAGRVPGELIATLPAERYPGQPGSWVTAGNEDEGAPVSGVAEYHVSGELETFLAVEYGRRFSGG